MKFSAEELPYTQLEALGLKKKDVLSLPPIDLNALLSGRRSSLMTFKNVELPDNGRIEQLDSKLSLNRNNDGSVSLKIHPINKVAPNIFNLLESQVKDLVQGNQEIIMTKISKENGEKDDMLIQYDPETREYIGKSVKEIIPPRSINDVKLTEEQRNSWKKGEEIDVAGEKVRVDLKGVMGFVGKVLVFGLDGGLSLAISSIIKASEKNKELTQTEKNTTDLKRTEKTDFEVKNKLEIPKDDTKKWVKVEDNDLSDNITVEDSNRFVQVDASKVGSKDVITLDEYNSVSADQSLEVKDEKNISIENKETTEGLLAKNEPGILKDFTRKM